MKKMRRLFWGLLFAFVSFLGAYSNVVDKTIFLVTGVVSIIIIFTAISEWFFEMSKNNDKK